MARWRGFPIYFSLHLQCALRITFFLKKEKSPRHLATQRSQANKNGAFRVARYYPGRHPSPVQQQLSA